MYLYITFRSIHDALKAENRFHKGHVRFDTIPVPRAIHSGCGLALRFNVSDREQVECYLAQQTLSYEGLYVF
jgi:hypothetical protein